MSLLKKVADVFDMQELDRLKEQERLRINAAVNTFVERVRKLTWAYCPDVKIYDYSIKYSFAYLDPGTWRIPAVNFATADGEIPVYVEVCLIATRQSGRPPASADFVRASVVFDTGEHKEAVTVEFDEGNMPVIETLPSEADLMTGVRILDYLQRQHLILKTRRAPRGHSDQG